MPDEMDPYQPSYGCDLFQSHKLTPVFLLAEKLTMFRPNAIIPLINNAKAFSLVISVAP